MIDLSEIKQGDLIKIGKYYEVVNVMGFEGFYDDDDSFTGLTSESNITEHIPKESINKITKQFHKGTVFGEKFKDMMPDFNKRFLKSEKEEKTESIYSFSDTIKASESLKQLNNQFNSFQKITSNSEEYMNQLKYSLNDVGAYISLVRLGYSNKQAIKMLKSIESVSATERCISSSAFDMVVSEYDKIVAALKHDLFKTKKAKEKWKLRYDNMCSNTDDAIHQLRSKEQEFEEFKEKVSKEGVLPFNVQYLKDKARKNELIELDCHLYNASVRIVSFSDKRSKGVDLIVHNDVQKEDFEKAILKLNNKITGQNNKIIGLTIERNSQKVRNQFLEKKIDQIVNEKDTLKSALEESERMVKELKESISAKEEKIDIRLIQQGDLVVLRNGEQLRCEYHKDNNFQFLRFGDITPSSWSLEGVFIGHDECKHFDIVKVIKYGSIKDFIKQDLGD